VFTGVIRYDRGQIHGRSDSQNASSYMSVDTGCQIKPMPTVLTGGHGASERRCVESVIPVSELGPDVGERAPDFTLQSTQGEINLRRFSSGKKLVLAFYVEDLTPG